MVWSSICVLLCCMHVLRTWIVLVLAAAAVMFRQVNWGSPSKAAKLYVGAFKMWELGSQPKPRHYARAQSLSLSLSLGQAVVWEEWRSDPKSSPILQSTHDVRKLAHLSLSLSLSARTVTLLDLVCAFVSGAIPSLLFLLLLSLLHQQFCLLYSVRCSSGMHTKHES